MIEKIIALKGVASYIINLHMPTFIKVSIKNVYK